MILFILAVFAVAAVAAPPGASRIDPREEQRLLLNPNALAGVNVPATEEAVRRGFADPAAEYRSMPLWVWNDEMDWARMKEQLAQFKAQGMGGVFVHPRPGLMTEYLGDEWFRLWKLSAEEGKRLGILVNIYDENSYPSGFAGGHVPSIAPDTAAQYVQVEMDVDPSAMFQRRGISVSFFAVRKDDKGGIADARRVYSAREVPAGYTLAACRLRRASGNPWTGEFPYVDLTNPQTAPRFLETTYEQYKKHAGAEFGRTVRWAFTDEPLIATGGAYDQARLALPLSYNTLSEFQKRNGYDLADHLLSLYWDVGEFRKVRFDYWQTLHDLWKENFMRPMFLWCDRNNLQFTGHWMEHEWPFPWITPADMSLFAYEHVPGIDLLEGAKLRTDGKDPHLLFTIKEVASVSHQLGRRAFCEAFGVAGWDGTLEHYKRFGDWLMVHGINFMDQHLAFSTVRGARKRDHPQSFSDVSAWWPYYKIHGDHMGRVSYLSSVSTARNRLLVLPATTSGFLSARRGAANPELDSLRASNAELNQFLADNQVDFDLGDEYLIEWFGKQEGKRFLIGKAGYDLVVLPKGFINTRKQTVPHLERWLAAGGEILAMDPPPEFVDGRPDGALRELQKRYGRQWVQADSLPALLAAIQKRLKPRVRFDAPLPLVGMMERWLPGGERFLFFANTGLKSAKAKAVIEGGAIEEWDTVQGRTLPVAYESSGANLSFALELAPAGFAAYLVKASGQPAPPKPVVPFTAVAGGAWRIQPDSPNVAVLDYCDIRVNGVERKDVNTWAANWLIWESHGFERPAWDNAVQFKTRIFDKNRFDDSSGFEAQFRFTVTDAGALRGLQLAMETPELYQVLLNGQQVDFGRSDRWLDPHIRSVNVEKLARSGENTVTVKARPFDVRMELENIYLRGNFSVNPAVKGFEIGAPRAMAAGSWAKQGMPFYADSVLYQREIELAGGQNRMRVELGDWSGSVVEVLLDGKRRALAGWPPYAAEFATTPGNHALGVRVVSTPRNVFGPFHNPTKPRMRSWHGAWAAFADEQPAGAQYDLLDYGLMSPPVIGTLQ